MALTKKFANPNNFFDKIFYSIDGCWYWTGAIYKNGYGQIGFNRKHQTVHRLSYELHKGKIPKHLCVLHSCDNRLCVNPDHLSLGTHKENTKDMIKKGRKPLFLGENASASKLRNEDVLNIRASYIGGESMISLAKKYGVRYQSIGAIIYRRTWKHI